MKAILVVDVPSYYGDMVDNKAIVTLRNGKLGTSLGIYNVPLKSMPKMSGLVHQDTDGWCELSEYSRGWNDCLDEIFGD